ncbi:MAG TPA: Hsp70 family protein [Burkholderiaceae bacterium]|nr:Hsp70 family protein [Burkholderiaceae bacterium]
MSDYCAIDFGTSNSALAYATGTGPRLAELEPGFDNMPTAVFVSADDHTRRYGRDAIGAYVDGLDGRLMRSIKSILGSDLMDETTEIAPGLAARYVDIVIGYLRHLRGVAQTQCGRELKRVVIGRPVFFVDDDGARDAKAQETLATAARAAGFDEVTFQFEPIAAALDYESCVAQERLVLVADIGGGTSDFSLVRASPARHAQLDRRDDILANHGVHIAGTDFDRAVSLHTIMPALGFGSSGPQGRVVPGSIYFELATWHLINATYSHARVHELRRMRPMYADGHLHARLLLVLKKRLGHALAAKAEQAKIDVSEHARTRIDLAAIEAGLAVAFDEPQQRAALERWIERIVHAADKTVRLAGIAPAAIDALYFTGGSTGLAYLVERIAARFPRAERVRGNRFSSVVQGLAITAQRRFEPHSKVSRQSI